MVRMAAALSALQESAATTQDHAEDTPDALEWLERAAAGGDDAAVVSIAHQILAEAADETPKPLLLLHEDPTQDVETPPGVLAPQPDQGDDADQDENAERELRYVHRAAERGDGTSRRALGDMSLGLLPTPSGSTMRRPSHQQRPQQHDQVIPGSIATPAAASVMQQPRQQQPRRRSTRTARKTRKPKADGNAALEWYTSAADAGDTSSLLRAADLLYQGTNGVHRDTARAMDLLLAAARQMSRPTLAQVGHLARMGDPDVRLVPDPERAFAYFSESAQTEGDPDSMRVLADLLWAGEGCTKDVKRAWELYERAVDGGCGAARLGLVRCLWLGIGTRRNAARARREMRCLVADMCKLADAGTGAGMSLKDATDADVDAVIETALAAQ
ncbi:hypothetical protein BC831DRAFT_270652 [Entophlyctis helioformis]|nr:hypothetical protein BC831DRAFT_270652 [Entophlyctis helioformis]